jgi:apolipoprotein D and lipocalin family protein
MARTTLKRRGLKGRWLGLALLVATSWPILGAQAGPDAGGTSAGGTVTTVSSVNLDRYAGLWFEIAKIPNRFQKQCARHTVAEYTVRPDGRLRVLNQCIKKNGNMDQASGIAKVIDRTTQAKLRVSFVSVLGWRPFWGDYWILGLDENYRWAVVGSPDRRYGWVLARTPRLEEGTMAKIAAILERNGYTWSRFKMESTER